MTGTIAPSLPTLGDPNSTEDVDVRNSLITLRDALNAVLTSANGLNGALLGSATVPVSALALLSITNAVVSNTAAIEERKLKNFTTPITALPGAPVDGDMCLFQSTAMATDGAVWMLRYRSGGGTYKWEFVGGTPLYAEVTTAETTGSGSYVALGTAGPIVTLPLAGDYDVEIGMAATPNTANGSTAVMSYDIGGTGAVDVDAYSVQNPNTGIGAIISGSRSRRKTGLTAVALTSKYKVGNGANTFSGRWMKVTPIRVGQLALVQRLEALLNEVNGLLDDSNHKPKTLTSKSLKYQYEGNGSPETVVIAPIGSTYRRLDGGAGTSFYVKESGTGNTGWIAK